MDLLARSKPSQLMQKILAPTTTQKSVCQLHHALIIISERCNYIPAWPDGAGLPCTYLTNKEAYPVVTAGYKSD